MGINRTACVWVLFQILTRGSVDAQLWGADSAIGRAVLISDPSGIGGWGGS